MSIDLAALSPMDPDELLERANAIGWRAIVRLRPDQALPDYVVLRSQLADRLCTVDVPVGAWRRLLADPAVESASASRAMPVWSGPDDR